MKAFVFSILLSFAAYSAPVIDDAGLMKTFQKELAKLADGGKSPTGKDFSEALKNAPDHLKVDLPDCKGKPTYDTAAESVVLLGSVGRCSEGEKCKKWHLRGVATAWCVSADGLFITNYHCFNEAEGAIYGVCTQGGRVAAVTEILAGDSRSDVCLIRVDGKDFNPLPLGETAEVGDKVRVISHPERRFFMQTSGEVARYYRRPARNGRKESDWMAITADYAKGSSGGPVLDEKGTVVGMVSSTQSIYYGSSNSMDDKGPLQMVVKSCVPGKALHKLVGHASPDS